MMHEQAGDTEVKAESAFRTTNLLVQQGVGFCQGRSAALAGERGQGRRTVTFILTIDAAPPLGRLGRGTKGDVLYRASFLDWRSCVGWHPASGWWWVCGGGFCCVVFASVGGLKRLHPSIFGHEL